MLFVDCVVPVLPTTVKCRIKLIVEFSFFSFLPHLIANADQFAPLWDSRRVGPMPAANQGTLSRTPSSTTLNKVEMMRSQSTLCRQGLWGTVNNTQPMAAPTPPALLKPPNGHMNSPNSGSTSLMINPRSGRSSAPPSQFRKSSAATVSCASSRRGDSTEDDDMESAINSDDEQSDEHRILRPRPVTPPKPNILKQIRRGSNSATNQSTANANHYPNNHYVQHTPPVNGGQSLHSNRQRRLWSTDTMRSSKSEFNLANIGRETPVRRRNNSGLSPGVWNPTAPMPHNDRLDLFLTNPTSIPRK